MTEWDRDRDDPDARARGGSNPDHDAPSAGFPEVGSEPEIAAEGGPSADIQSYIGVQLRAVYDDVAQQPIPDRFIELMKRLG